MNNRACKEEENAEVNGTELNEASRKEQLINLGNELWGVNSWSYAVTRVDIDFTDFLDSRYYVGVVAFVKLVLENGTFREEMGYCNHNGLNKGITLFKARKVAITLALMEAFRSLGGQTASKLSALTLNTGTIIKPPITEKIDNTSISSVLKTTFENSMVYEQSSVQNIKPLIVHTSTPLPGAAKIPKTVSSNIHTDITNMTVDEIKAERLRRQKIQQEEFRRKMIHK